MNKQRKIVKNRLKVGDRIHCRNWKDLLKTKAELVKHGFHVEVNLNCNIRSGGDK